jgi:hypothetical protein
MYADLPLRGDDGAVASFESIPGEGGDPACWLHGYEATLSRPVPRRNRVDPWGDLHAVTARGMFTGNRGCLVDDAEHVVRHHASTSLWITCLTEFRGWRVPLARPRRWTPIFFLDDAVALAAGHRPCATCRRADYLAYRDAVTAGVGSSRALLANELDLRLTAERLQRGRGIDRAKDRRLWVSDIAALPVGTVIVDRAGRACLLGDASVQPFSFRGWGRPTTRPSGGEVTVLTPPTSVAALRYGFTPTLHPSAG